MNHLRRQSLYSVISDRLILFIFLPAYQVRLLITQPTSPPPPAFPLPTVNSFRPRQSCCDYWPVTTTSNISNLTFFVWPTSFKRIHHPHPHQTHWRGQTLLHGSQ